MINSQLRSISGGHCRQRLPRGSRPPNRGRAGWRTPVHDCRLPVLFCLTCMRLQLRRFVFLLVLARACLGKTQHLIRMRRALIRLVVERPTRHQRSMRACQQ